MNNNYRYTALILISIILVVLELFGYTRNTATITRNSSVAVLAQVVQPSRVTGEP